MGGEGGGVISRDDVLANPAAAGNGIHGRPSLRLAATRARAAVVVVVVVVVAAAVAAVAFVVFVVAASDYLAARCHNDRYYRNVGQRRGGERRGGHFWESK